MCPVNVYHTQDNKEEPDVVLESPEHYEEEETNYFTKETINKADETDISPEVIELRVEGKNRHGSIEYYNTKVFIGCAPVLLCTHYCVNYYVLPDL